MARARRPRQSVQQVSDIAWAMLNDLRVPDEGDRGRWEQFTLRRGGEGTPSLRELWEDYGPEIVSSWAAEHPGTRPSCWWRWSAPRWAEHATGRGDLCDPRRRVGGIGTPAYEVLGYVPELHMGMPARWVSAFDAEYYNGRARDVDGKRIGTEHRAGSFKGVPPDPRDPPTFESQASYLDRHGLFLSGERKRLGKRDFAPEAVVLPSDDP